MTNQRPKHFTVSVYLISTEKSPRVLLVWHRKLGKWMQPGGHIEPDENPLQAAIREVEEETGLDISSYLPAVKKAADGVVELPLPDSIQEEPIPAYGDEVAHFHLDLGYIIYIPHSQPQPGAEESSQIKWFTKEEARKLDTFEYIKSLINSAL